MPWFLLSQSATKTWTTQNVRGWRLRTTVGIWTSVGTASGSAIGDGATGAASGTTGCDVGTGAGWHAVPAQVSAPTRVRAERDRCIQGWTHELAQRSTLPRWRVASFAPNALRGASIDGK